MVEEQTPKKNYYIPNPAEGVYRANIDALNARSPGTGTAIDKILEGVEEKPISIEDDIRVTSLKNPVFLVILGFSTRKVLEAARKHKPVKDIQHVVIIEPDYGIFKQTLKREYIADLILDETIDIVTGSKAEELQFHLFKAFAKTDEKHGPRASKCQNPEIITDPFVYPAGDEEKKKEATALVKVVQDAKSQVFTSMGCASDSFNRWEQMVRNLPNIHKGYKIEALYQKFQDVPVIVAGAGPSMKDLIAAYKEYDLHDKALLIACDASLNPLLKEGIRPHIVTRCERKLTTIFDGVTREKTKGIYYAAYPWCSPEYFDLFEEFFMVFRGNGVCNWTGYKPGEVNGGVSSANAALELAFLLGSKNIVLTGIDLCFLDGQTHVAGTDVEFDPEKSKALWEKLVANDGSEQTTIPIWKRCLSEYRHSIFRYEGAKVNVFNTSTKGANIHGAWYRPWSELKPVFSKTFDIKSLIAPHFTTHEDRFKADLDEKTKASIEKLKASQKELKKLFLFLDDAMMNTKREEQKVMNQTKSHYETPEYFHHVEVAKKSLVNIFNEPCRQIDNFKRKYFTDPVFNQLILDMCQLDLFSGENHMHSLRNKVPIDHERLKAYIAIHVAMFRTFQFYVDKMIDLLEKGPDPVKYDEKEDLMLAEARL